MKPTTIAVVAIAMIASRAHADSSIPPWTDADDVPMPSSVRSVAPRAADVAIYAAPGKLDARRGSAILGARLPIFGAKRSSGCRGRWLLVGPLAWVCSDVAELSPEEVFTPELARHTDGLPFHYYFAGRDGAFAFTNLERALDDAPDQELDAGFGVAVVEEKNAHGERWVRTRHDRWIALRELAPARTIAFHGEQLSDVPAAGLDIAWVLPDHANVYGAAKADKPSSGRVRFQVVAWREEVTTPTGLMVRISVDGAAQPEWMRARDLAHPSSAPPPEEVGGASSTERWIDVELASQTLVAFEGTRPVFATMVSTGRGPLRSETVTPPGVHRVWVKLTTTTMDNDTAIAAAGPDMDAPRRYQLEDVPFVQFFDKAVALHGAFWHSDFGHVHSHGCVNLAPLDARWLFGWTAPHLPGGWAAVFPTRLERGTVVRVR